MRLPTAVAALALACGGKPAPRPPPAPDPTGVRSFRPLELNRDTKAPNQAVILGTDAHNGSTVIALPTVATHGRVDAMFVRLANGTASGGSTPVKLATGPNTEHSVQVGVFEEMAGGTGPQWRAGVWVSAIIAASTLGKDLTDFTFSATSGGYIDGASASGLMAGGFLATMTGAPIDPTVTMTGIINPDGTIGPVGGIPEKFAGSIEKGKKRLGYPIGMRTARSAATGKPVDLVQLAKDRGAEAVEIASVYEAYKLLTGKALPEPVPVPVADMALDPETDKALDAKYQEWLSRYGRELAVLVQLDQAGRLPETLTRMAELARTGAERADHLHKQHQLGAAYQKMLESWVYASAATTTYNIVAHVQAGDFPSALREILALEALDKQTAATLDKIAATTPSTMGGHLQVLGAYQAALRGWGFKQFARDAFISTKSSLLRMTALGRAELRAPEIADRVVQAVAPTVELIGLTVAETQLAEQRLEFETEKSIGYQCSVPNVHRMSTSFQSAGAAGLNYFETLIVQGLADRAGLTLDQARARFALREPNYLVALVLARMPLATTGMLGERKQTWGETSLHWNLMSLAGSQLAYAKATELVAKYYSLGVRADGPMARAQAVEHEKAFLHMLASAERAARSNARAARIATGAIPVQAKLAYQLATVQRAGDIQDKLDALASYWTSSSFSQTAVMFARN